MAAVHVVIRLVDNLRLQVANRTVIIKRSSSEDHLRMNEFQTRVILGLHSVQNLFHPDFGRRRCTATRNFDRKE